MRLLYAFSALVAISLAAPVKYDAALVESDLKLAIAENNKLAATIQTLSPSTKPTLQLVDDFKDQTITLSKTIVRAVEDGVKSSDFGTASVAVTRVYCELSTSVKNALALGISKKALFESFTTKQKDDLKVLVDDFQDSYRRLSEVIVGRSEASEQKYAESIAISIDNNFKALEKLL